MTNATRAYWFSVAGCSLVLVCSISAASLWIDEGFIAWVVSHTSLTAVARSLNSSALPSPADRQYPLYDLWEWSWVHLFGTSEYALRLANFPFGILYVTALALASRYGLKRRFAWIPFAFAPFVWYYMNEARPYMMLTAFATATVAALTIFLFGTAPGCERARHLVLPLLTLTILTHILAVLLIPGLITIAVWRAQSQRRRLNWEQWRVPLLIWALPLLAIGMFYAWTLIGSSGRAEVLNNQNRGGSPLLFTGEILYEQLGLAGLGPSRNALRDGTFARAIRSELPWISIGIFGLGFVLYRGLRDRSDSEGRIFAAAWALTFVCATAASDILHSRFLGRHLAAIMPLLFFTFICLARTRSAVLILATVFVLSDLRLSLVSAYAKDDYRRAVAAMIDVDRVKGGTIAWAADDLTAGYYGLTFGNAERNIGSVAVVWPLAATGTLVSDWAPQSAQRFIQKYTSRHKAVYLALSRPDIFDTRHGWAQTIVQLHARAITQYEQFDIFVFSPK